MRGLSSSRVISRCLGRYNDESRNLKMRLLPGQMRSRGFFRGSTNTRTCQSYHQGSRICRGFLTSWRNWRLPSQSRSCSLSLKISRTSSSPSPSSPFSFLKWGKNWSKTPFIQSRSKLIGRANKNYWRNSSFLRPKLWKLSLMLGKRQDQKRLRQSTLERSSKMTLLRHAIAIKQTSHRLRFHIYRLIYSWKCSRQVHQVTRASSSRMRTTWTAWIRRSRHRRRRRQEVRNYSRTGKQAMGSLWKGNQVSWSF